MPSGASLLRVQLLGRIQVAQNVRRKSPPLQFVRFYYAGGRRIQQQINSISSGAQSLFGGDGEFASINSTQGLPTSVTARNDSQCRRSAERLRDQVLQKQSGNKRHIQSEYEGEVGMRGT